MGRRYGGRLTATLAKGFAQRLAETKRNAPRYCTSANAKTIQDLMIVRAQAAANGRVLGRNLAFAEYQARNDLNQERRMQAINVGRGLVGQAATLYASAGLGLAELNTQMGAVFEAFAETEEEAQAREEAEAQGSEDWFRGVVG